MALEKNLNKAKAKSRPRDYNSEGATSKRKFHLKKDFISLKFLDNGLLKSSETKLTKVMIAPLHHFKSTQTFTWTQVKSSQINNLLLRYLLPNNDTI